MRRLLVLVLLALLIAPVEADTGRVIMEGTRLVKRVEDELYVTLYDVYTGELVEQWSNVWDETYTYSSPDCRILPGTLVETSADAIANVTHAHTLQVVAWAEEMFGWQGLDGVGQDVVSTVHCGVNTGFTCDQKNAAFSPWLEQFLYGDGGDDVAALGTDLDIVAHEFMHGVTWHAITWPDGKPRGLDYRDESGALNESYSDFFAAAMTGSWLLGETAFPGGLRDMEHPARFGQPEHYSDYVTTGTQSYRVHTNSGIMNKAAFLLSRAIGVEAALRLWRVALPMLPGDATFLDFRNVLVSLDGRCAGAFYEVGVPVPFRLYIVEVHNGGL